MTGAMICAVGGQFAWLASGMEFKSRRPVYSGDIVTCWLVITEVDAKGRVKAEAIYNNQHGEVVVSARVSGHLFGPGARSALPR
jgi:acyl dehydratase